MFKEDLIVFLDGEYLELKDSKISPMSHSLHYGSGVFEGIRAYETTKGTGIFELDKHIDRLFYSASKIEMDIPFSKQELKDACLEVLRRNNLKSAYLRPLAFFDGSSLGIETTNNKTSVLIAAWDWGKYLSESARVQISDIKRISEKSTISDAKFCGHYINSLLAKNISKNNGFDEALLLDHNDNIAEGPGENVFFIKENKLITPSKGKILEGITREFIINKASVMGYQVEERDISLDELSSFDGAFFTGTAAEITPISEIDNSGVVTKYDVSSCDTIKEYFFNFVLGREEGFEDHFDMI